MLSSNAGIHTFSNGVRVREHHLIDLQRERYQTDNVHEAEEEPVFVDLIERLPRGATFVNVGAAIGYYVILAKLLRPDILAVAYEPLRIHRRYLRENLRLNGLRRSDVRLVGDGLSAGGGPASFMIQDFSSMIRGMQTASGPVSRILSAFGNSTINTVSLGELVNRVGGRADLVQMDIQGLELPVLKAAQKLLASHVVDHFLIGTHSLEIHSSLKDLLSSSGYRIEVSEPDPSSQPDGILSARVPD